MRRLMFLQARAIFLQSGSSLSQLRSMNVHGTFDLVLFSMVGFDTFLIPWGAITPHNFKSLLLSIQYVASLKVSHFLFQQIFHSCFKQYYKLMLFNKRKNPMPWC